MAAGRRLTSAGLPRITRVFEAASRRNFSTFWPSATRRDGRASVCLTSAAERGRGERVRAAGL